MKTNLNLLTITKLFISITLIIFIYLFLYNSALAVTDRDYHDHINYPDSQPSKLPAKGRIMYYNPGVMQRTWLYRHNVEKYPKCDECVGNIATMRDGDKQRKLCIQRDGVGQIEGPFYVIDVANEIHKDLLRDKDWLVDVGWPVAEAWNMNSPIPATLLDCPIGHTPILLDNAKQESEKEVSRVIFNTNFRSNPSLSANKIGLIPKNSSINVLGITESRKWLKVSYNNQTGFVASFLVNNIPNDVETINVSTAENDPKIVAGKLRFNSNLRSGPGTRYQIIGYQVKSSIVRVKETSYNANSDWYQLDNDKWIYAPLVSFE